MLDPHITKTLIVARADRDARIGLAADLDLDGYAVHEANRSSNLVDALARVKPDALLLGPLEQPAAAPRLLRALRAGELERTPSVLPVLTIGANDPVTQIRAYEDGSDHHVARDIGYATLRVILAAVLRRAGTTAPAERQRYEVGTLMVDVASRDVTIDGGPVKLTPREFDLLRMLASDPERVFAKDELLRTIWGYVDPSSTRTLDSHACRLRRRLAEHGQTLVVNRWGVGYRLLP